jgi:UDP-2,3-diacylglucosamine pyrophosphatase LpxH
MNQKPVTIIISDLHVGGGQVDPGDDHVYDRQQLVQFLDRLVGEDAGANGKMELIINGDFLEFAQVVPEAYALGSGWYWCSEEESLTKLTAILDGHPEIFQQLRMFQERGNIVTLAAGNHDVELYWPAVQAQIRAIAGNVQFETGHELYYRYGRRLAIGHGHMYDPANRFEHWDNPILDEPTTGMRLEMCSGTLFMVKFVNWLESQYPFSDNIKPITALGRLLWTESKLALLSVAWVLSRFMARHPQAGLGSKATLPDLPLLIRQHLQINQAFAEQLTNLYRRLVDSQATVETVRQSLDTDQGVEDFLKTMIVRVSPEEWLPIFNIEAGKTLGIGQRGKSLAIISSGTKDEKLLLREQAKRLLEGGTEVVVFGHTHQPDKYEVNGRMYFNPGSWTRYLEIEDLSKITLADLANESDYPYRLNFVCVEETESGPLKAAMYCFEKKDGRRFGGAISDEYTVPSEAL